MGWYEAYTVTYGSSVIVMVILSILPFPTIPITLPALFFLAVLAGFGNTYFCKLLQGVR